MAPNIYRVMSRSIKADLDNAKVVWAREITLAENRKLLEYFHDQQPWLLEIERNGVPPKLVPYAIALPQ